MSRKKRAKQKKTVETPSPEKKKRLSFRQWIRQAWANPAYRFVFLFLVYLGGVAVVYPLLTNEFYFIVEGMMVGTAQVEGFILGM